jgi:hypothetical protein
MKLLPAVVCLFAVTSASSSLAATHNHCDFFDWKQSSSITNPVLEATFDPIGNTNVAVIDIIDVTVGTAESKKKDCDYEISDVGLIEIILEWTGSPVNSVWSGLGFLATQQTGEVRKARAGPFSFTSGSTFSIPFKRHQGGPGTTPGPWEFSAPAVLSVSLIGPDQSITLNKATVTMSGTHYFLSAVPVPASFFLGLTGIAALGVVRRLRRTAVVRPKNPESSVA